MAATDQAIQLEPRDGSPGSSDDGLKAIIEAGLLERLRALESEEYQRSEAYRLGDRVWLSAIVWACLPIVLAVITLALWH